MSGRGAGYCAGYGMPGGQNPGFGRSGGRGAGAGRGFGRGARAGRAMGRGAGGRGWRHMFWATGLPRWLRFGAAADRGIDADPKLEQQALARRAVELESELAALRARLSEIESHAKEPRS